MTNQEGASKANLLAMLSSFARITLLATALAPAAFADDVMPSDRVSSALIVREGPSRQSAAIDRLEPGERAELMGEVPLWREVRLPDGRIGYVSKSWSIVVETPEPETPAPAQPVTAEAPSYTLHVVDVGTGLAVIVRGADFTLVYDGGSNDDLARGGNNRLLAYMRHVMSDVTEIDELILSHPHRDHVELLADLFAAYDVRQVWDSGRNNPICGYRRFIDAVHDESGVIYHDARADLGPTLSFSFPEGTCGAAETVTITRGSHIDETPVQLGAGAYMEVLHADGADFASPNENSIVLRLDLGPTRVLFMGDAEAGGRHDPSDAPDQSSIEGELLACCLTDLRANILIVGHHGSKTSSRDAFLDAVDANLFVVSSGPKRYGTVTLPDNVVIDDLAHRGAVWRTDISDAACPTETSKIGPDDDGRAGGCDNIQIAIPGDGHVEANYYRDAD